ncbi:hypothetical protein BASA50_009243 [Batrachochytrium salamandrivorans]|uniref:Uncharacterized protein n=1 Tax=Batrachochytrium salamandrivorans TaxID=1357716 RepID=A0ABQ8F322_9FUNG|nr:hypothetical protein BASA50_009243 [Batrachochytrium salamandrivorans]
MRLSTGIILSILSANVFAIEHPNGAHSGSLLARRAVVADTDSPLLQKRNNDKDQKDQKEPEEQAKPKVSPVPDSDQEKHVYIKRLSFVDAPRDFSSRVLGYTKKGLSPAKLEFEWWASENRFLVASERVSDRLVGKKGTKIGNKVYVILRYTFKISKICKKIYKDPVKSPFSLYLPSAISDESKEIYKGLRDDVLGRIKLYILDINTAIKSTINDPKYVIYELDKIVEKTNDFYEFISSTKPRYSSFLAGLGISDNAYLERLDMHIKVFETYKVTLSKDFNDIEEMVKDYIANSKQRGTSKSLSFSRRFKRLLGIKTKSSEDGASGSAQSEDGASGSAQPEDGASGSAQPEDRVSGSAQSNDVELKDLTVSNDK